MIPRLIIFDFDGTLADTTATILRTYRMAIEMMGAPSRADAECQATIGVPLKEGFRQLYPDFTDTELDRCVNTYRGIFNANKKDLVPHLYTGVKDTLDKLVEMGVQMTIASSRSRESLVDFCEENGIAGHFSLILGADDVPYAKPNPAPVLITLKRLMQEPEQTLVVGDMPVDIAMGNGADCRTVGVTYGNSNRRDLINAGAHYIIDSFPELIERVIYSDRDKNVSSLHVAEKYG